MVYCFYFQYIIYILEEIYRSRKVMTGVLTAAKVFPNSILAMGMAGMLRSNYYNLFLH